MNDAPPKGLHGAWKLAALYCPHCDGLGGDCKHCDGTGDLMRSLLEGAYRRGREDALVQMREVFRVARLAGVQVSDLDVPELKQWSGL